MKAPILPRSTSLAKHPIALTHTNLRLANPMTVEPKHDSCEHGHDSPLLAGNPMTTSSCASMPVLNLGRHLNKLSNAASSTSIVLSMVLLASCASTAGNLTNGELGAAAAATKANALAQQFTLVDTHIDVPFRLHRGAANLTLDNKQGEFDFPKAQRGGLDGAFMSIYIPASVDAQGEAPALADKLIDDMEALVASAPAEFTLAHCSADVGAAKAAGKVALPLGMENGGPIAGDVAQLTHFRERGIRYITLAHSKSNHISDSSYDNNRRWNGLSPFGIDLLAHMNQQGVMVDVSHLSDQAFWQVLQLSAVPVIASHSSLRHFTPGFERNMDDAMVTALGAAGGVVQINFGSSFLTKAAQAWNNDYRNAATAYAEAQGLDPADPDNAAAAAAFATTYRQANPYAYASINDVLDHIDRAVTLAGIDSVGLGSDFDGVGDSLPIALKHAGDYPNLIAGLIQRGYSDAEIEKIMSGNVLRVWQKAEAYAAQQGTAIQCSLAEG